ncbi:hypothetical protein J7E95_38250 [Streptomyces sp. ISL-14]|nr:hypothetical protein [Streptomyces sp. ISL-14]
MGQEFSVEALVQHGRPVFASVTTMETPESVSSSFVELSHRVPCAFAPTTSTLPEANCEMPERLGFEDGIAHSQWRLTADGRPRLMEVAARTPGDCPAPGTLSSKLLSSTPPEPRSAGPQLCRGGRAPPDRSLNRPQPTGRCPRT